MRGEIPATSIIVVIIEHRVRSIAQNLIFLIPPGRRSCGGGRWWRRSHTAISYVGFGASTQGRSSRLHAGPVVFTVKECKLLRERQTGLGRGMMTGDEDLASGRRGENCSQSFL